MGPLFVCLLMVVGLCVANVTVSYEVPPEGAAADPGQVTHPPSQIYHPPRSSDSVRRRREEAAVIDGQVDVDTDDELFSRREGQNDCSGKYPQAQRDDILQYHNNMRSTIARGLYVAKGIPKPPAVNMRKMYYSCILENTAQQVADNCVFAHSNRAGRNIGENLYQYKIQRRYFPAPVPIERTGIDACKAWEVEFEKFGWPSNLLTESSFQTGIGHATQMGWWKSSMIGCGVAQCFDNNYQKLLVVCHYRDTGNWINENMYNSGATCSSCGEGYSCETSSGLCTV